MIRDATVITTEESTANLGAVFIAGADVQSRLTSQTRAEQLTMVAIDRSTARGGDISVVGSRFQGDAEVNTNIRNSAVTAIGNASA